jgi:hypothetical protein
METFILRPKRDRRAQPRFSPPDVADRAHDAVPTPTDDSDIVVRVEEREGVFLYVVTVAPGVDELQSLSAEEAVAQALACARRRHTRAWFKGDTAAVLLEDFRDVQLFQMELS